jgi:hypothetical protein
MVWAGLQQQKFLLSAMNHYRDSKRKAVEIAIAFAETHNISLHLVWVCETAVFKPLRKEHEHRRRA